MNLRLKLFLALALFGMYMLTAQKGTVDPKLQPYVDFLSQSELPTAKDYIMDKFETYDIVILSERSHQDFSQYDIIFEVLKDPNFKGNLYTESGSFNSYKRLIPFLLNDNLSEAEAEQELLAIYRDIDYNVIWEMYSFYALIKTVYNINKTRDKEDKILMFPLDLKFDWKDFNCHDQYKLFDTYTEYGPVNRDEVMGNHFWQFYEFAKQRNPKRNKALVIENTYHAYIRIPKFLPSPTRPLVYSTGQFIYKTYPDITTNIYINYHTQGFAQGLTNDGLFDAAFQYTEVDNVGFDLKDTPFGDSTFDLYNFGGSDYEQVNFDYIFDGMIFYKPISEMELVTGIPKVYPKQYEQQFFERYALVDGISVEEAKNTYMDYLKEINEIKRFSLADSTKQKIKAQIAYWLK